MESRIAAQLGGAFWRAHRGLTAAWLALLALGAILPTIFAMLISMITADIVAQDHARLVPTVIGAGLCLLAIQVLPYVDGVVTLALGSRLTFALSRRLVSASLTNPGVTHLENPAVGTIRDIDQETSGPPLFLAVNFMHGPLLRLLTGVVSAILLFVCAWWASLLLVAVWLTTYLWLGASGMWRERKTDEVTLSQQHAGYAYELATGAEYAKEIRLFGLQDWVVARFTGERMRLCDAQYRATRLRARALAGAAAVVVAGNALVFWFMGVRYLDEGWPLQDFMFAVQLATGVGWMAFGGLSWAADDVAAAVGVVQRLEPLLARTDLRPSGRAPVPTGAMRVELREIGFRYPAAQKPVYDGLNLVIPQGCSLAIVGANGAGKTSLAKLLCRFHDPDAGRILVNGVDLTGLDLDAWHHSIAAVFQDFAHFDQSLRTNVDPGGHSDDAQITDCLRDAGLGQLLNGGVGLDTPMNKGYRGGADLSGGQWQRVALARVLCAVRRGAQLVILDEPTSNLDVHGETTLFSRLLQETRGVTTILISHRFSTVRAVDQIAVLDQGRVVQRGSHIELMARDGHYRRMFTVQSSLFGERGEDGEHVELLDS